MQCCYIITSVNIVMPKQLELTYTPNGVKVTKLGSHDDGEYFLVKSITTGKVFYAHKGQITEEEKNVPPEPSKKKQRRGRTLAVDTNAIQQSVQRININGATPELLTKVIPGVGLKTANEIKDLQRSMPGERFTKLSQLESIGRVDWNEVFKTDALYVE